MDLPNGLGPEKHAAAINKAAIVANTTPWIELLLILPSLAYLLIFLTLSGLNGGPLALKALKIALKANRNLKKAKNNNYRFIDI